MLFHTFKKKSIKVWYSDPRGGLEFQGLGCIVEDLGLKSFGSKCFRATGLRASFKGLIGFSLESYRGSTVALNKGS